MKNKIGEKHITKEGYTIEIIECFGWDYCTIKFDNGVIIKNREYGQIKKREIKNPYHKSVKGFGYFGVGKYSKATHYKIYTTWCGMLERCYSEKAQERCPTYVDCSVDGEWHNFQNFAEWFEEYYIEGFELDKDILFKGNKIYSAKTCCFAPNEVNIMFIKRNSKRGKYPIGVIYHKRDEVFYAQININGKKVHLGLFDTPEEAFQVYKIAKEKHIKEVAEKYKNQITESTYRALIDYKVEITD